MEYSSECGMSVRQVMKRTVVTSTTTTSSGIESDRGNRSLVEMTTKQAPGFPRHDVKMFARDEFSTMSSGSFSNGRNSYGSVYERSFTTKTIGGGGESRRFIEHITKPSGGGDEHPIVLVRKERSQIDLPEWMRERKSPNAERRGVDIFNVNVFLKYPSGYSLSKRKPEADGVNENKIRPEVAKRDKTEIPMIPDDEEEEEEHITKPSGRGDEHPIVLVRKERSQIDVPEWMEERKSPNAEGRGVDISNLKVFLKYPSGYSLSKRKPEADGVNENKIRPEVAKRDKTEIPMIPDDEEEEEEHITKPSDRGDEHPIVLVRKERSQIDVPEWMEERKSPNAEGRGVDISNLKVFLKYPSGYSLSKRKPEADGVNENKIRPEVAKRDKTEIPMIPDDEEEEEEHITKPSGRGDEHPIVLVRKERSQIDVPEWMEERKSPNAEGRGVDISNLKAFLKYPSGYSLSKRKPEADGVNENKIRPEVAKRDKTEIPMIPDDEEEEEEHITKPSGRGDEHPIVLVRKERSQIDVPEWMEERKSPNAERRGVDISNLKAFLKYPSGYSLRKRKPEVDRVNESKIRPEVAKRDKTEIPMILDDDDEEEEESDEEYDEFEEEIVIVDIRRKPIWRKGLEIPKPQPQKAGVPIEDLLEIPTLKAKQESAPDKLIDEKIDSTERPPVVFAELPDFGVLENL